MIEEDPAILQKRGRNRRTILHYTAEKDSINIVKLLIKYKTDVNAKNSCSKTLLYYTIEAGNIDIDRLLILKRANPYLKDKDDQAPLDYIEDSRLKNELLFLYRNRDKI